MVGPATAIKALDFRMLAPDPWSSLQEMAPGGSLKALLRELQQAGWRLSWTRGRGWRLGPAGRGIEGRGEPDGALLRRLEGLLESLEPPPKALAPLLAPTGRRPSKAG
jgi:hypothetical protein